MCISEVSMFLFDFAERVRSCRVLRCFLCVFFRGLALSAPCICLVYSGVPFSITNLCIPIFTY